jgi:hypothetical protein
MLFRIMLIISLRRQVLPAMHRPIA